MAPQCYRQGRRIQQRGPTGTLVDGEKDLVAGDRDRGGALAGPLTSMCRASGLVSTIPRAHFTRPPYAILTAADGDIVRAKASGTAPFGLINRGVSDRSV